MMAWGTSLELSRAITNCAHGTEAVGFGAELRQGCDGGSDAGVGFGSARFEADEARIGVFAAGVVFVGGFAEFFGRRRYI